MAGILREIVSENKIRYRQDGYDLDLTYITPSIIAMGYPSKNLEGVYRNHVNDVARFMEERHSGHYLVINLCSEKAYNPGKFNGRACTFPMDDHGPPPFQMFLPFCRQVDEWLSLNPHNIVAVHCKAGKNRTGTMIAAYFLYKGMARSAEEAIYLFAVQRTHDGQVMIPSQRRYVKYFERMLSRSCRPACTPDSFYQPVTLGLTAIVVSPTPHRGGFDCDIYFTVQSKGVVYYTSEIYNSAKSREHTGGQLVMVPRRPVPCCEDVKIVIYSKAMLHGKEEMLRFWFNTFFVSAVNPEPQQQILQSSAGNFNSCLTTGSGANSACTSCQSNQQNLPEGPSGSFVSVVRLSNTGPSRPLVSSRNNCGCAGAPCRANPGLQKALTLHRSEMESNEKVGPEDLAVTLYFNDTA